jgi:hypothetical protein
LPLNGSITSRISGPVPSPELAHIRESGGRVILDAGACGHYTSAVQEIPIIS